MRRMKWWEKMMIPMRKVFTKVSRRIRFRRPGHIKLRRDVRTCEYEDVHILWDMLKKKETDLTGRRKVPFWKLHWAKCAPLRGRRV